MERTLTVRLRALIGDYQSALAKARGDTASAAKSINRDLKSIGADLSKVGGKLSTALTLPLVGLGAGAGKLSVDFDTTFTRMITLAGVSANAIGGLKSKVLELAAQTGRGPQELADALYFASSAGYDASTALDIVTASAKASAVGLGSTQSVTDAVTNALGAYGTANITAAQATDILFAAARVAKVEASQIAPQLGRLLPLANQLHIGLADVAGSIAYLTQSNGDAAQSATFLQGVFQRLLVPTAQGDAALKAVGLSLNDVKAAISSGGLAGGLELLRTKFAGNSAGLQKLFTDIQGYTGAVQLMENTNGNLTTALDATRSSAGDVGDSFGIVADTDGAKLKRSLAEVQGALIALGAVIVPVAATIAGAIGPLVEKFSTLPTWIQQSAAGFGLFIASVGPIARIVGGITSNFATLKDVGSKALSALRGGSAEAASGLSGLGVALGVAAIAVGTLAYVIGEHNRKIEEARARQNALADSLRETNDAATTLSSALGSLLTNEAFVAQAFAKAGVTVAEASAAAAAGGQTWTDMRNKILDGAKAAGVAGPKYEALKSILNALPKDLAAAAAHNADLNATQAKTATTASAAAGGVAELGGALGGVAADAANSVNALDAFLNRIDDLFASTIGLTRAQEDFDASVASVGAETSSAGGSTRNYAREQRDLEKAVKEVTTAQNDLAAAEAALALARKGATPRELKDAGLNIKDADLGLAEAKRRVRDAQKTLAAERKKGRDGDVAGATLDLKRSQLDLERATLRASDARAELNDLQHSGEEGSKKVKAATDDLSAAQGRLTDAEQRVKDMEEDQRKEASSGGPLADRQRKIAESIDKTIDSGKNWIDNLFKTKAPEAEIRSALEKQIGVVDDLAAKYGDADGKLAAWKKTLEETKGLLDNFIIIYIDGAPLLIPRTGFGVGSPPPLGPQGSGAGGGGGGGGGGGTLPGSGSGPAGPQAPPATTPIRSGGGDIYPDYSFSAAMTPADALVAAGPLYSVPYGPQAPTSNGGGATIVVELGGRPILQTVIDQADLEGGAPIRIKAAS